MVTLTLVQSANVLLLMRWEDHLTHIQTVLEALRINGLTAIPQKCVWGARQSEYLGHVVGGRTIAVPEARVTAIRISKDQ